MTKPLIVIPARIGSTRLPEKPLQIIGSDPLIVHVLRRCREAEIGEVWVSTDDQRVRTLVIGHMGNCLPISDKVTYPKEACGSDRVAAAADEIELRTGDRFTHVINVQGDMPFIEPELIRAVWAVMQGGGEEFIHPHRRRVDDPDIVTAQHWHEWVHYGSTFYRRGDLQHIGIYGFTRESLKRFAVLRPSKYEIERKLEGCRAQDNGMTIQAVDWPSMPLEINTESDLKAARHIAACLGRSGGEFDPDLGARDIGPDAAASEHARDRRSRAA